jgi:hypothetical protein
MSVLKAIKTTLFGGGGNEPRVIPARYNIGNKRDPGEPERRFFMCRIDRITVEAVVLVAPVTGDVGEKIIVQSDELGEPSGPLVEHADRGFKLDIHATDEERDTLARKLKWLAKHHVGEAHNRRNHRRVVPREPLSPRSFLPTAARRPVSSSTCRRAAPRSPPTSCRRSACRSASGELSAASCAISPTGCRQVRAQVGHAVARADADQAARPAAAGAEIQDRGVAIRLSAAGGATHDSAISIQFGLLPTG